MSTFISESDTGIYNAMNKGLIHAKGEYVLFLNGEIRLLDPNPLKFFERMRAQMSCTEIWQSKTALGKSFGTQPRLPLTFLRHGHFRTSGAVKRSLMLQYGGFDESYQIAGDYEFFARLFQKPDRTSSHLNSVISEFGSDGISNSARYRRLRKRENHRLMEPRSSYRGTFKCWRHILKRCVGLA